VEEKRTKKKKTSGLHTQKLFLAFQQWFYSNLRGCDANENDSNFGTNRKKSKKKSALSSLEEKMASAQHTATTLTPTAPESPQVDNVQVSSAFLFALVSFSCNLYLSSFCYLLSYGVLFLLSTPALFLQHRDGIAVVSSLFPALLF
jgi:hypothetical protein